MKCQQCDKQATFHITELTEGTFNTAYRIVAADGTRWVLKIAPRPDAPAMTYERTLMRTEAMFYRTAAGRLPVPRIRYTSTTPTALGSDFLLMTECPGASWHSQREGLTAHAPRLRTDLGGPQAPNDVTSVLPGALAPVLIEDGTCGKWFSAQDYR